MGKFEAACEVLKGENGPVIAGIGGIVLLVGTHLLFSNKYSVEVKNGDKTISVAPTPQTE